MTFRETFDSTAAGAIGLAYGAPMSEAAHWEQVWSSKADPEMSWYQESAEP